MSTPDLTLSLEGPAVARRGYPLLVAVTLGNPVADCTYYELPVVDRFSLPPPVQFVITAPDSDVGEVLPARPYGAGEDGGGGAKLDGGESRRMLCDLADLHPRLVAGRHRLTARYLGPIEAEAAPIEFEVEVPGDDEAAAVARLRASNTRGEPSWAAFVAQNFREIEPDELRDIPPAGQEALAFTLTLQRAVVGPWGTASLHPSVLRGLGDGVLAPELLVLEHELLRARDDPGAAALAATILARWPSLAWRIADNDDRRGQLWRLRRIYGAERSFPPLPDPLPYGGARP